MNHTDQSTPAIAWTIAGSDSGGGAGIQADLKTFHAFGVHGCSVITAITAQNSVAVTHIEYSSDESLQSQLTALSDDLPATAIKLGMQANSAIVAEFLQHCVAKVVFDPVMVASSGASLSGNIAALIKLIPYVDIITPNIIEAEKLTGISINSHQEMVRAALALRQLGAQAVLLKGGHYHCGEFNNDYYCDAQQSCWLAASHIANAHTHGSGCTLASAITAALALNYSMMDAVVIANMYVHQGIRLATSIGKGEGAVVQAAFPSEQQDLPLLSDQAIVETPAPFAPINDRVSDTSVTTLSIGLYPVVDSAAWVLRLAKLGVTTIQLRIKSGDVAAEIKAAIAIGRRYSLQLFINDHWQLALTYQAYGVHLGQQDLQQADLAAIRDAGLRLGISTHCFYEVARAHALRPSYIACGPIFATTSKEMPFAPQGLQQLAYWRDLLDYPLVAIGGINLERAAAVVQTGVDGIAMISAITHAKNLETTVSELQHVTL